MENRRPQWRGERSEANMLAAANTYVEAGRHPVAAANLLLLGFTGNLLAWWERLLGQVLNTIFSQDRSRWEPTS